MLRVGNLGLLEKNLRVLVDMVLLRTSESGGTERISWRIGNCVLQFLSVRTLEMTGTYLTWTQKSVV